MRLTAEQHQAFRAGSVSVLGADATVRLFGSRTDDSAKGGGIDLYFETADRLDIPVQVQCQLYAKLIMALGDRKIDVLLKDARTADQPIFEVARQSGLVL
jgi:hypothetical protein